MELYGDEWGRKGATLSDKTARAEFGLTQDEIIAAIRAGKLQYRPAAMHGNPWLRLLRCHEESDAPRSQDSVTGGAGGPAFGHVWRAMISRPGFFLDLTGEGPVAGEQEPVTSCRAAASAVVTAHTARRSPWMHV
jgi:hypothetical protein